MVVSSYAKLGILSGQTSPTEDDNWLGGSVSESVRGRSASLGIAGVTAILGLVAFALRQPAPPTTAVQTVEAPRRSAHEGAGHYGTREEAIVRFSRGQQLVRQFLGSSQRETISISSTGLDVRFMIVTMPDPYDSHLDWMYDAHLDAVRRAFQERGLLPDRFYLPARDDSVVVGTKLQQRSLPARELQPGVLLFRKPAFSDSSGKSPPQLWVVYVVHETPTYGINKEALRAALCDRMALIRALDSASASRSEPIVSAQESQSLRILGPTFSGAAPSLLTAIRHRDLVRSNIQYVRVVSGSATSLDRSVLRCFLGGDATVRVDVDESSCVAPRRASDSRSGAAPMLGVAATVHSDAMMAAVVAQLRDRLKIDSSNVAIITESQTAYGAGGAGTQYLTLPIPLNIASLHSEFDRTTEAFEEERELPGLTSGARTPLSFDQEGLQRDAPWITSKLTVPTLDVVVRDIERTLQSHGVRLVILQLTDVRDKLILASAIRRRLRDVVFVVMESNVLLIRPEYRNALKGSFVISTYSMAPDAEWWFPQDATGGGTRPRSLVPAGHDLALGVFNATIALSTDSLQLAALRQYQMPGTTKHECRVPPLWLSVVGNGRFFPIGATYASGSPDANDPALLFGHHQACSDSNLNTRTVNVMRADVPWTWLSVLSAGTAFLLALLLYVVDAKGSRLLPDWLQRRSGSLAEVAFALQLIAFVWLISWHLRTLAVANESDAVWLDYLLRAIAIATIGMAGWRAVKWRFRLSSAHAELPRTVASAPHEVEALGDTGYRSPLLLCAALLLSAFVGGLLFASWQFGRAFGSARQGDSLAAAMQRLRMQDLLGGASSVMPLLTLSCVFGVWALWQWQAIRELSIPSPLEEAAKCVQQSTTNTRPLRSFGRDLERTRRALFDLVPDESFLNYVIALAIVVAVAWAAGAEAFTLEDVASISSDGATESVSRAAYRWSLYICVAGLLLTILAAVVRFLTTWHALEAMLELFSRTPFVEVFSKVPTEVVRAARPTLVGAHRWQVPGFGLGSSVSTSNRHWIVERSRENLSLHPLVAQDDAARISACIRKAEADGYFGSSMETPDVNNVSDEARHLALEIGYFVANVMFYIRRLAGFLVITLFLGAMATTEYIYQPQAVVRWILSALMIMSIGSLLLVISGLSKNAVLRRITQADEESGAWDTSTFLNIMVFTIVPLLAFLAMQIPAARSLLYSWVEPLLRSLTH